MWRNYLTVGLRSLGKNRTYAFINIFGLALGIAACLIILTYVRYEHSYDAWMPGADRAFQLQDFYKPNRRGGEEYKLQMTSYASGQALKKDFPQVDRLVYMANAGIVVEQDGQATAEKNGYFVDGPIFDILQVPFVKGDPAHALDDPHSVVLSETAAKQRFGTTDPIGKTLTLISRSLTADYRVTGVFRDLPPNSHLDMTMVARFDPHTYYNDSPTFLTSWNSQGGYIYARLRPGTDVASINDALPAWEKRNIPDETVGNQVTNAGDDQNWKLVNIRDVHLGVAQNGAMTPGSDEGTIVTFTVIAAMILMMACINFTNLATARASQRAREVSLRKVLGAKRHQLITQFLGESIIVATIATVVALALAELALRPLNAFLDADMGIHYLGSGGILLPVIVLILIVGVAGGAYPAIYLSRFQPAHVLKANRSASGAEGSGRLRNLLVIVQFAVSIGLLACTAIIYAQTVYARTVDAGYKRDGLLQIDNLGRPQVEAASRTLVEQIRRMPGIVAAGRTTIAVASGNNSVTDAKRPDRVDTVALGVYGIDPGFIDAMGMRILAGRNFSDSIPMDDSTTPTPVDINAERAFARRGANIILSESAAKRLGFASPQAAVGKPVQVALSLAEVGLVPATVVGVVSDVRYRTARDPLQPIFYYYQTRGYRQLMVRFTGDPRTTYNRIERLWKQQVPDIPFQARYVTTIVHDLYNADAARSELFAMFALLAVLIGCLGLFGLAAFTAERRTKEIGIRKVLGAKTRDIVRLLVWQFSRPVLIANLIAWPIAWWIMRNWLNGFEMRIGLSPLPFLAAGLLALVIAIATIAAHAWHVAQTRPIKALRYE